MDFSGFEHWDSVSTEFNKIYIISPVVLIHFNVDMLHIMP